MQSTDENTTQIEVCQLCGVKVRVQIGKLSTAHCPKCSGPLGNPKIARDCPACQVTNRVLRSRFLHASCGKCHASLVTPTDWTRENVIADACGILQDVLGTPVLATRLTRPRNLYDLIGCFEKLPILIGEAGMIIQQGPERVRLTQLAQRLKGTVDNVRPLCFPDSVMLFKSDVSHQLVADYLLEEAFQVVRLHPIGWQFLKTVKNTDNAKISPRDELRYAAEVFIAIIRRVEMEQEMHQSSDKRMLMAMANSVRDSLQHGIAAWLPRPVKLSAIRNVAMSRLGEVPQLTALTTMHDPKLTQDVLAYLSMVIIVIARIVSHHELATSPKDGWAHFSEWFRELQLDMLTTS